MLKVQVTKRGIDAKVLDMGKIESAAGQSVRQSIALRQGIDRDLSKEIIKIVKDSKIKVVNINSSQQKMITVIIKRHCRVSKEGWEHGRSMTYFYKIDKIEKYELIRLVTDLLLSLYREGWEPMTPIDLSLIHI